jgi:hypothetical protein
MSRQLYIHIISACAALWLVVGGIGQSDVRADYRAVVVKDQPVVWWSFEGQSDQANANASGAAQQVIKGKRVGRALFGEAGPRSPHYPGFGKVNQALKLSGDGARIQVKDPGEKSALDFDKGDTITLEAWVNLTATIPEGQQVYIVGKGRTLGQGGSATNQNYALRLRGVGGKAGVSFLFRDRMPSAAGESKDAHWHRWTSQPRIAARSGWHYVAVTYTFGKGNSIRGFIDGQVVTGKWDMGGKTDAAPVVDNDDLWIGSSLGGSASSTFSGLIDEVAIYRKAIDPKRIATRYKYTGPKVQAPKHTLLAAKDLPHGKVRVDIIENIPNQKNWTGMAGKTTTKYQLDAFGVSELPTKYNQKGLIVDRTNPFLVRAAAKVNLDAGTYRILVRARNASRLFVDGKSIASTRFISPNGSAHEKVPELSASREPGVLPLSGGDQEAYVVVKLSEGEHVFQLEAIAGGKRLRAEIGELAIAIGKGKEPLALVSPSALVATAIPFDEPTWQAYVRQEFDTLQSLNASNRKKVSVAESAYWDKRHKLARSVIRDNPQPLKPTQTKLPAANTIDHYVNEQLVAKSAKPTSLVDDYVFVRRVYLDTVGVVPTRKEVQSFIDDVKPNKRSRLIDVLLDDNRWADHWVSYWQDVLAENPGILKPKLNNTGPFRWWIYESFLDNKPIDRFATELIMMEGSRYQGGPAGFAMATQNDMPMAAKAHVIGQAFLGVEMKCARCHDAPHHPFVQRDLFNLAAMLDRKSVKVPKSSVVPVTEQEAKKLVIDITLKPGEVIHPDWPFKQFSPPKLSDGIVRNDKDSRERFAALLTSPYNKRFAQVIANRLWKRLMGKGIVEPVGDWSGDKPSHPAMLQWLGDELASNGYDLKHIARLIFNSRTYQRVVVLGDTPDALIKRKLFAGPSRRRMTAEQLVDSMLAVSDKRFRSERLTFDPEGRKSIDTFINLGSPRRAWYFVSLANERDRPALALPMAQGYVDVLRNFGWRESRQDPLSTRDQTPTVLQPLVIANGMVGSRVTRLSDDSAFTAIALRDKSLHELIDDVFLHVLSRMPSEDERDQFEGLLTEGFGDRVVHDAPIVVRKTFRTTVSWSNHLNAEATLIKQKMEQAAYEGDPVTKRLKADWRERMEDMVWALVNSPEFLFVP